jgi:hypothetical protein
MDKFVAQRIQKIWETVMNKKRSCMYAGCDQIAIKSHVLQKNGILREISVDNHLMTLARPNIMDMGNGNIHKFKKMGVNDVYTFPGFCNAHDTSIFSPIETNEQIDFNNPLHQALFSYRGLCQELFRKQTVIEYQSQTMMLLPKEVRHLFQANMDGSKANLINGDFFKPELERAIQHNEFSKFTFKTIRIPKIDLCISVPLNLHKPEPIPENVDYEEWKSKKPQLYPTGFVNVIPFKDSTYVILGYHNDYPCNWTTALIAKLSAGDKNEIFKELSDLVVLRLEFWVMSPKLFAQIPAHTIEKYKEIFTTHLFSHDEDLKTELNLFEGL